MAVTFDGPNKKIVYSTSTTFAIEDVYADAMAWACLEDNMQYLLPLTYTSPDFILMNGWKFDASGYAAGTVITITGSTATDDNSSRVTPGSGVQWELNKSLYTIMVATGSGVTAQDKVDIADAVRAEIDANSTKLKAIKRAVQ